MPSALWQRAQWRIRITDRTVTGAIMGRAHIMADMAMVDMDRPTTAAVGVAATLRPIMADRDQVIMAVVGAEAARTTEVAVGVVEVVGIMGVVVDANDLS